MFLNLYREDALGSGCLLLSDMPAERMREFRRFSVEVPRAATPSELAQIAERWVRETATFCAPFIHKNEHFAKTGSG